jgi:hypothetical protein
MNTSHVLGLSGGKDSSALAIYMKDNYPDLDIKYFFTDTGEELKEVYVYLDKLEAYLGKPIARLNQIDEMRQGSKTQFEKFMHRYNNFLPSATARWCTIEMKLKPFEKWVQQFIDSGSNVISYVAIRADEKRLGYKSTNDSIAVKFPFVDDNIDKEKVSNILDESGLGLPGYYKWRSRSGCSFCFFQQKIEWVRLSEEHPELFKRAQRLEKTALDNDSPFTWVQKETLGDLIKPERVKKIKEDFKIRLERERKNRDKRLSRNPFLEESSVRQSDIEEVYGDDISSSCLICHK